MNPAAFGADPRVTLDSSPFHRSRLTEADAVRELNRMASEPRVDLDATAVLEPVLAPNDADLLTERLPEAYLQALVQLTIAIDSAPEKNTGFALRYGHLMRVPHEEIIDVY